MLFSTKCPLKSKLVNIQCFYFHFLLNNTSTILFSVQSKIKKKSTKILSIFSLLLCSYFPLATTDDWPVVNTYELMPQKKMSGSLKINLTTYNIPIPRTYSIIHIPLTYLNWFDIFKIFFWLLYFIEKYFPCQWIVNTYKYTNGHWRNGFFVRPIWFIYNIRISFVC